MKHKIEFRKLACTYVCDRLDMWITAWLALACAIVVILTFCYYQPKWDLKFWLRSK